MTRYSNVGLKRKYLQATSQFKEDEGEAGPSAAAPSTVTEVPKDAPETEQPAKKKRKRGKPRKPEGATDGAEGGEQSAVTSAGQDSAPKKTNNTKAEKGKKKLKEKRNVEARKFASERRRLKRQQERDSETVCYACREKGHSARFCPKALASNTDGGDGKKQLGRQAVGICYRCGSKKHSLSKCKAPQDPENPLPFASCFVCSGKGHLASACPQNQAKGVYPNGGCCKLCGETSHLAKDCALRKKEVTPTTVFVGTGAEAGADEDDFHIFKRKNAEVGKEEKADERRKKTAAVKVGAFTGTVQAFGKSAPTAKKVVVF